jgi:hypothetical protein
MLDAAIAPYTRTKRSCHLHFSNSAQKTSPAAAALTFLVLNLAFDVVNGVTALHLQCDGLAGQGLDKYLQAFVGARDNEGLRIGKKSNRIAHFRNMSQKDTRTYAGTCKASDQQRHIITHTHTQRTCIPPRRRKTKCSVDSFWML